METIQLTNDADKVICYIYKDFLQSRKNGLSKAEARRFPANYHKQHKSLSKWSDSDFSDTILELGQKDLITIYLGGTFELTNDGIIYMENRFKNGLIEITDFITKFIP